MYRIHVKKPNLIYLLLVLAFILVKPSYGATHAVKTIDDPVLVGLHINNISAINDTDRSFAAEFDLWLRFKGKFNTNDLVVLNTLKPVALDAPNETSDENDWHFRLFHVNAVLRFGINQQDIHLNIRRLSIQLGWRHSLIKHRQLILDTEGMGLDKNGTSWEQILRDDSVFSGATGVEMRAGELLNVPVSMGQRNWIKTEPALLATMTFNSYRNLYILFAFLWWLVPTFWLSYLLPAFVWDPIGQRTGHPIPSISRLIVQVIIYIFSLVYIGKQQNDGFTAFLLPYAG